MCPEGESSDSSHSFRARLCKAADHVLGRNQHLIRSTIPTSHEYESTKYPTEGIHREWTWLRQVGWLSHSKHRPG